MIRVRLLSMSECERGSVTAWMVMVPLMVMLLSGMSVDLWAALSARGRVAAIADEAAVAGASAIAEGDLRSVGDSQGVALDPGAAQARALAAVDGHPQAGLVTARSVIADTQIVSVTVEGQYEFLFLQLVGATTTPISVTGSASPQISN